MVCPEQAEIEMNHTSARTISIVYYEFIEVGLMAKWQYLQTIIKEQIKKMCHSAFLRKKKEAIIFI